MCVEQHGPELASMNESTVGWAVPVAGRRKAAAAGFDAGNTSLAPCRASGKILERHNSRISVWLGLQLIDSNQDDQ